MVDIRLYNTPRDSHVQMIKISVLLTNIFVGAQNTFI